MRSSGILRSSHHVGTACTSPFSVTPARPPPSPSHRHRDLGAPSAERAPPCRVPPHLPRRAPVVLAATEAGRTNRPVGAEHGAAGRCQPRGRATGRGQPRMTGRTTSQRDRPAGPPGIGVCGARAAACRHSSARPAGQCRSGRPRHMNGPAIARRDRRAGPSVRYWCWHYWCR